MIDVNYGVPDCRAIGHDDIGPICDTAAFLCRTSSQVVTLMDGLVLLVNPNKGALLPRIADEIYRHYGTKWPSEVRSEQRDR